MANSLCPGCHRASGSGLHVVAAGCAADAIWLTCWAQARSATADAEGEAEEAAAKPSLPPVVKESLLRATVKARKDQPEETEAEITLREEQEMLADMSKRTALRGVKELAKVRLEGLLADLSLCRCSGVIDEQSNRASL